MNIFPTKDQLLKTFLSCSNWEEKYMYIMDLGELLPKFPTDFRQDKYLVTGCQSYTWIVLIKDVIYLNNQKKYIVKFYGDSEAAIIKGTIVIIFSLYQYLDIKSIADFNINPFLDKLQLTQHLTMSRAQGINSILHSIRIQVNKLL